MITIEEGELRTLEKQGDEPREIGVGAALNAKLVIYFTFCRVLSCEDEHCIVTRHVSQHETHQAMLAAALRVAISRGFTVTKVVDKKGGLGPVDHGTM